MGLLSRSFAVAALTTMASGAVAAHAASNESVEAGRIAAVRLARTGPSAQATTCTNVQAITPPVTINTSLTTSDCIVSDGSRAKAYSFQGTAGKTLTIDYKSNAYEIFFVLDGPQTLEFGDRVSFLGDGVPGEKTLTYVLPATGTYTIEAQSLFESTSSFPTTGPFTLIVGLSGGRCTSDSHTLCLNNGRFQVTTTWRTPDGVSGVGTAIPLSSDTGYFWFFNSANVELVVKALDARLVNGKFWIFYGALSDVNYTITVVDTEKSVTKTYTNPQGKLASVADTSAFNP